MKLYLPTFKFIHIHYYFHERIHHNGLTQKITVFLLYSIDCTVYWQKLPLHNENWNKSTWILLASFSQLIITEMAKTVWICGVASNSLRWCGNRKHEIIYYNIDWALHVHPQKNVSPTSVYTGICTHLIRVCIKLVPPLWAVLATEKRVANVDNLFGTDSSLNW